MRFEPRGRNSHSKSGPQNLSRQHMGPLRKMSPYPQEISHHRGSRIIKENWKANLINKESGLVRSLRQHLLSAWNYPPNASFNQSKNPFSCGLTLVPRLSANCSNNWRCSFVNLVGIATFTITSSSPR